MGAKQKTAAKGGKKTKAKSVRKPKVNIITRTFFRRDRKVNSKGAKKR